MKPSVKLSVLLGAVVINICGCASIDETLRSVPLVDGVDYDLSTEVSGQSIHVQLRSLADRPICYSLDHWPTPGGWVPYENSEFLHMEMKGTIYFMVETRTARNSPPFKRLGPREKVKAVINLEYFELPPDAEEEDLEVFYRPTIFNC